MSHNLAAGIRGGQLVFATFKNFGGVLIYNILHEAGFQADGHAVHLAANLVITIHHGGRVWTSFRI
jgi:hypothetical protein